MSDIPADMMKRAAEIVANAGPGFIPTTHSLTDIARALMAMQAETEAKVAGLLKNPAAVRLNWIRGGINCDSVIAEITDRHVTACLEYADGYKKGLPLYGAADKDIGRGRQEGHIKAATDIARIIKNTNTVAPTPRCADGQTEGPRPSSRAPSVAHHNDDNHVSAPMQEPLRP